MLFRSITIYEREPVALINSNELIILDSKGICLPVEYCDLSLPILSNFKSNPELYPKGSKTISTNVLSSISIIKYTKDNFSMIYDNISEFVFNEEIFYFYTPCQKISSSEFVIEVRRENQNSLDSIENYHLHIGLADLTEYQRDGENLIEYKKEFKLITLIVRYDQNMFIKEIIYKYKFDYNIKKD